ncbi:MAG: hypothetical protein ACI8UO_001811 [Verrucomicrobiales bacterium]|jgi:hypothetical protein
MQSHRVLRKEIAKLITGTLLAFGMLFGSTGEADGHFDLYHNFEVNLQSSETITLFATIHETDLGEDDFLTFLAKTYVVELAGERLELAAKLDETETDLPEGCQLVSLEIPNPGQQLLISLANDSDKRLMLVVTRPAAFPDVRDIEPGSTSAIELPDPPTPPLAPPPPPGSFSKLPWILIAAAALAISALWFARTVRSKRIG